MHWHQHFTECLPSSAQLQNGKLMLYLCICMRLDMSHMVREPCLATCIAAEQAICYWHTISFTAQLPVGHSCPKLTRCRRGVQCRADISEPVLQLLLLLLLLLLLPLPLPLLLLQQLVGRAGAAAAAAVAITAACEW